jgi:hypothetical protein
MLEYTSIYILVALNYYMSHIEIYKIKGRKYKYCVTNYRDKNGKVKHKKKYMGPVKPINKTKKK